MQYKSKDADKLNEENESIIRYVPFSVIPL